MDGEEDQTRKRAGVTGLPDALPGTHVRHCRSCRRDVRLDAGMTIATYLGKRTIRHRALCPTPSCGGVVDYVTTTDPDVPTTFDPGTTGIAAAVSRIWNR